MENTCSSCKFWDNPGYSYSSDTKDSECFRFPPTPVFDVAEHKIMMIRPATNGQDNACGEWKEK